MWSLKNVRFEGKFAKWVMTVAFPFHVCYDTFFLSTVGSFLLFLCVIARLPRNNAFSSSIFFEDCLLVTSTHFVRTTLSFSNVARFISFFHLLETSSQKSFKIKRKNLLFSRKPTSARRQKKCYALHVIARISKYRRENVLFRGNCGRSWSASVRTQKTAKKHNRHLISKLHAMTTSSVEFFVYILVRSHKEKAVSV